MAEKEQNPETYKFVNALERLIKYPEWEIYIETLLKPQLLKRKETLIMEIYDNHTASEHNVLVGEIYGINLAITLPQKTIEAHYQQEETDKLIKDMEK